MGDKGGRQRGRESLTPDPFDSPLPAVMSVRGIMNLITDGQTVLVDGTNGIVEIKGER
jgi:hypothetical protein